MNLKKLKRLVKQTEAVSPVVATLMLVLVAAGAAVGLNLFMNSFQEDATQDVGIPDGTQALKIAGSSTVYEFSIATLAGDASKGLPAFEDFAAQAGTPIKVELEKGGSGAGRQAVGLCLIDIGSSSSDPPATEDKIYPDCDRDGQKDYGAELKKFHIAYDTVAMVTPASGAMNCDGVEINEAMVYELYRVNGAGQTPVATPTLLGFADDTPDESTGTEYGFADIGCTDTAGPISLHDRSDPGGTEDGFCGKVLKDGHAAADAIFPGLVDIPGTDKSYGCTNDAEIDATVFSLTGGDGNQGIADNLDSDPNGLSFIGFGHVTTVGGLDVFLLDDKATTGGGFDPSDIDNYPAVRNLWYITAGEPTPVEQIWLDFVLDPHRNQLIAANAGYVSVY